MSGFGAFQGLCTEPAGTAYIDQRLMLKDVDQPEFTLWASMAGMADEQHENKRKTLKESLEYQKVLKPTRNIDEMWFIVSEGSARQQKK